MAVKVKRHAKFDPKNPHLPLEDQAWRELDLDTKKLAWAARDALGIPRRKRGVKAIKSVRRSDPEPTDDEETVVEAEVLSDEESEDDAKLPAAEPDDRVVCFEGVSLNRQVMRSNLSKVAAVAAGVHPSILRAPIYRDTPTTRRAQIYGDKKRATKQVKRTVSSVTS